MLIVVGVLLIGAAVVRSNQLCRRRGRADSESVLDPLEDEGYDYRL